MKDKRVFEFDKKKHGISFDEAKLLWQDKNSLIVPAKTVENEDRFALIARLNSKCYVDIFTLRDNNYRIISVRRCRNDEEKNYDNSKRV